MPRVVGRLNSDVQKVMTTGLASIGGLEVSVTSKDDQVKDGPMSMV